MMSRTKLIFAPYKAERLRRKAEQAAERRREEEAAREGEIHAERLKAKERERAAEERKRAAKERRDASIARALTAFPGHWTVDYIVQKRHWERSEWLDDLFSPDVVVRCGADGDIELFKAVRVRAFEATNEELKNFRVLQATFIRNGRAAMLGKKGRRSLSARHALLSR